jgi:hypothetical protein
MSLFAATGEIFGSVLMSMLNRFADASVTTRSPDLPRSVEACWAERSSATSFVPRCTFSSCVAAGMLRITTVWNAGFGPQKLGLASRTICVLLL